MPDCKCCKRKVITKQGLPGILGTFALELGSPNQWTLAGTQIQDIDNLSQQLEEGKYLVLFDAFVDFVFLAGAGDYALDYYLDLAAVEVPLTRKTEAEEVAIGGTPHDAHIGIKKIVDVPVGGGLLKVIGDGTTTDSFSITKADLIILKLS